VTATADTDHAASGHGVACGMGLVRLAGWLAGWLISCERKILLAELLADFA